MKLTFQRRTDLGLRALRKLQGHPGALPGPALAKAIGTTVPFLPQVMSPLVQAGWVTSERGPHGGYRLVPGLNRITLLDVIQVIEGPIPEDECVLQGGPCHPVEPCALHGAWTRLRASVIRELAMGQALEQEKKEETT